MNSGATPSKAQTPAQLSQKAVNRKRLTAVFFRLLPLLVVVGMVAISTALSFVLSTWLAPASLTLIYLTGVLLVAMSQGLWPSLLSSALSYLVYSYFFDQPLHSFHFGSTQDWLDLAAFMAAAIITGTLASKVRSQLALIRKTAEQNHQLYDFTRGIAGAITRAELTALVREHVSATLHCPTQLLLCTTTDVLAVDDQGELSDGDFAAAQQCLHDKRMTAGRAWTFVPLSASGGRASGVLGVCLPRSEAPPSPPVLQLLLAMRDQSVVALERIDLAARIEQTQLLKETERLREALLSSVSHDLRTPLASIIGAATTLRDLGGELREVQRNDLLDTVIDESSRLNRFVQNLLDMTRIGYGALKPRAAWADLREIIGPALRTLSKAYPTHRVQIEGGEALPPVWTDAVLLERVLFNLLDNAAKYAPDSEPISLSFRHDQHALSVIISDRGPGIPDDEREQIFDMFHRVQRGDATPAGTGMGLAICRGLMQALDGSIVAEAGADGRGTSMILTLNLHPATP